MAIQPPLGRDRAMQLVAESELPIPFGSPQPSVLVVEQDGVFRIRELVIDRAGAEAATRSATRARSPSWMPAHYYSLGQPTGRIFVEAASREELVASMRTMAWPADW